jgi:ppGpp synthetase/RelA/SpoT-type nucleotidyltranferase
MITPYDKLKVASFTKGEIRRSGEVLKKLYPKSKLSLEEAIELENAQTLILNWRRLHLYPINTLQMYFRRELKKLGYESALFGQRLKRLATMADKLSRIKGGLDSFQDIGGIRIILKDMNEVNNFIQQLKSSKTKHKIVKEHDYVAEPKKDGYRCIHYVYEAVSNKAPSELNGLKVELQLRTLLQHYWATAVESVGMFYGESIKTGGGSKMWNDFFLATSAAFAYMENLPLPQFYENCSKLEIQEKLREIDNEYVILKKLEAVKMISDLREAPFLKKTKFVSLVFQKNAKGEFSGHILPHHGTENDSLLSHETFCERIKNDNDGYNFIDAVFVKSDAKHLKKVYSNYFLEIDDFIKNLKQFLDEE